jgi:hypothetical protein
MDAYWFFCCCGFTKTKILKTGACMNCPRCGNLISGAKMQKEGDPKTGAYNICRLTKKCDSNSCDKK